jgi:two-component system sensor histidine kinase KdpD
MNAAARMRQGLTWALTLTATTAVLLRFRGDLDKAHIALVLLLVVLGAGAAGGRALGIVIGAVSFLLFDLVFLPPYGTLAIANPLDWLVLVAFLVTSVVASQLLHREQESARRAEERAEEVDRLATVGAEALNAPRAEDALAALVSVIRGSTGIDACTVYLVEATRTFHGVSSPPADGTGAIPALAEWAAREGAPAAELEDGASRLGRPGEAPRTLARSSQPGARALYMPLAVRGVTVGVLHLAGSGIASLDDARWRFLDALAYYAALGAERVQLAAEAERAGALREADRLKDALIASVSHDLRTPLTTIKALAHDLGALGDERSQIIEEQADRLNHFVADLLDLSRLTAGAMPQHIELNAVDDLLSAALQEAEGRLAGRHVDVELPGDGALLVGRFDLAHSVRVLVNLIENAHKYSPPGAPVTIAARRDEVELVVSVGDRGAGVPAGEEERIFTPFYRPPGMPGDSGSAGLGLAIARRMAEAQGGHVRYEPRSGGGSLFVIRLPAVDLPGNASSGGAFTKA